MTAMRLARTLIVLGKGGVGKTTVALVLARHFAARGERVLFVALDASHEDAAFARSRLPAEVELLEARGDDAMSTYLTGRLPAGLHQRVTSSELYRRFVAAAPGFEQLMALGQICAAERDRKGGAPRYDHIVVDAPPSGQAIETLRMPLVAAATSSGALVRFEIKRMRRGLSDPERTAIVPVTLAEETPVQETLETIVRIEGELGMSIGAVVTNRVRHAPQLGSPLPIPAHASSPAVSAALEAARVEAAWAAINATNLAQLRAATGAAVIELPLACAAAIGTTELDALGRLLFAAAEARAC